MKYTNPILKGDYSDPDVIRHGEDYYMVSSSFTYLPGLPVLHSRDLVHWRTIGYAAERLPFKRYDRPAHKCGVWAPSLRWHEGLFYVYACLPDEGLFAFTAKDPAGPWQCHWVLDVCGWIDPCPFWDDDGNAYLLHGFAASRSGINNLLYLHRMSPDGLAILDKGRLVYNGFDHGDTTVEGPKMYRRREYYYILCPAGGVATGYQLALRSRDPYGPYERRVVLSQGDTPVNGPHQGGLVDDGKGQDYFIHFQDVGAYGRVPHLQPVMWVQGWPMMGRDGFPVLSGEVAEAAEEGAANPMMSDDFGKGLSLQWQWQANPNPAWYSLTKDGLRLHAWPADSLFSAGHFLSQLMQHFAFDADVGLTLHGQAGDRAGLAMMGYDYSYAMLEAGKVSLVRGWAEGGSRWEPEKVVESTECSIPWREAAVILRLSVRNGRYAFFCGTNENQLAPLGAWRAMSPGGWTSARPGIFCLTQHKTPGGWADFRYFRVTAVEGAGV